MHLEVLVEDASSEAALEALITKIAPACTFRIHPHSGKPDLLARLPGKLKAYRHILGAQPESRVVVLLDEDRQDCRRLKKRILDLGRSADIQPSLLARVAVEELEAWFLGDVPALATAYPRVPLTLANRRGFRDPDAVAGGTWEALQRVLQGAGYYRGGGLPKIEAARSIAARMDVEQNQSRSFNVFRDGIRRMVAQGAQA